MEEATHSRPMVREVLLCDVVVVFKYLKKHKFAVHFEQTWLGAETLSLSSTILSLGRGGVQQWRRWRIATIDCTVQTWDLFRNPAGMYSMYTYLRACTTPDVLRAT